MKPFGLSDNVMRISKEALCAITMVLTGGFFLPLGALNYVQCKNFFMNKTTSERYGHQSIRINPKSSKASSVLTNSFAVAENSNNNNNGKDNYALMDDAEHSRNSAFKNCRAMFCLNSNDRRFTYDPLEAAP